MTSYPFIIQLFTNVLAKSKAIGGRFFVTPKGGIELNSDTLDQVLTEAVVQITGAKKYPLAIMLPPRSRGEVSHSQSGFHDYFITLFFLKQSLVEDINPTTQTSLHTVANDWHDMRRAGESFLRVISKLQKKNPALLQTFRLPPETDKTFTPVSLVTADRVSGVRLDFVASLFSGCELEDYTDEDISSITLPSGDSHPEHAL